MHCGHVGYYAPEDDHSGAGDVAGGVIDGDDGEAGDDAVGEDTAGDDETACCCDHHCH